MATKQIFEIRVNGCVYPVEAAPDRRLLEVLREDLGLGSVREGCGMGICGTCTVLLDGRPVSSCLLLVSQVHHQEIVTVEGLGGNGTLHPIQQAFISHFAFQCAYCTPGFILSAVAMLEREPDPDEQVLREYLSGNLCRCGSYLHILQAVRAVVRGWKQGFS